MKIIFVGICNKKGFEPLDSNSRSGKRIDDVIKNFQEYECLKVNLFDSFCVPGRHKVASYIDDFFDRMDIHPDDICVLLGGIVQRYLGQELSCKFVYAPHPSPLRARFGHEKYVKLVTESINEIMSTP